MATLCTISQFKGISLVLRSTKKDVEHREHTFGSRHSIPAFGSSGDDSYVLESDVNDDDDGAHYETNNKRKKDTNVGRAYHITVHDDSDRNAGHIATSGVLTHAKRREVMRKALDKRKAERSSDPKRSGSFNQQASTLSKIVLPKEIQTIQNNAPIHVIHVLNPYVVTNELSPFYPLDMEQWITLQSIQRAQSVEDRHLQLDFVCAVFESDIDALEHLPCRKVLLTRSTQTEYSNLSSEAPSKLPFLQDLYHTSTSDFRSKENRDFYWVYTNSDIGLNRNFYSRVIRDMRKSNREAVSVNRVDIPFDRVQTNVLEVMKELKASRSTIIARNSTNRLLQQIDFSARFGNLHPGFDCFVIHSSVMERMHFGDFFTGRPPWGFNIHLALEIMAKNYKNVKAIRQWTFHIGQNTSKWREDADAVNKIRETSSLYKEQDETMKYCPSALNHGLDSDIYGAQNIKNCGDWFKPNRQHKNHPMPSFVKTGWEDFYLDRYYTYIVVDDGRPVEFNMTSDQLEELTQTSSMGGRFPRTVYKVKN